MSEDPTSSDNWSTLQRNGDPVAFKHKSVTIAWTIFVVLLFAAWAALGVMALVIH